MLFDTDNLLSVWENMLSVAIIAIDETLFGEIVFENGLNLASGVFLTKQTQMGKEDGQGQELGRNVDREEGEALPDTVFWKLEDLVRELKEREANVA